MIIGNSGESPVRTAASIIIMALAAACSRAPQAEQAAALPQAVSSDKIEIRWDEWGVPHITSMSGAGLAYGLGWAQMRGRGDLVLKLMGEGRGRAAEYWGAEFLPGDEKMWRLGVPQSLDALYAAQGAAEARQIDAFADAINDFAAAHPDRLDPASLRVLPVTGKDVLGHVARVIHLEFVLDRELQRIRQEAAPAEGPGSNAWAVAPSRSASGAAMLLANPHLPWADFFLFYEAHLTTPEINAYGVALIGQPFLAIAFNDALGWTHTVNTYDGADAFSFAKADGGYLMDGVVRPFSEETAILKVRRADGTLEESPLAIRRTLAGPIVAETVDAVTSVKVAGLADAGHARLFEQYWKMAKSKSLDEFERATAMLQMPMFNTVYADRHGDIFYLFNALLPARASGDAAAWAGTVEGDAKHLWTDYRGYEALPKFRNPSSGFIQNANEPPWTATLPPVLDPAAYPGDLVQPFLRARPQNSLAMISGDPSITYDELISYAHSTRLVGADSVLTELFPAARASDDPLLNEAATVLGAWDRRTDPDSRGAILFIAFAEEFGLDPTDYRTPWRFAEPGTPPSGLADPAGAVAALLRAAAKVRETYGALDAPWSAYARIRRDGFDLPVALGPGEYGAFRVGFFRAGADGRPELFGGTSYVAAVEFGEETRARAILPYGNFAVRPDGVRDQFVLLSEGRLRPVNFSEEAVEASVIEREYLTP